MRPRVDEVVDLKPTGGGLIGGRELLIGYGLVLSLVRRHLAGFDTAISELRPSGGRSQGVVLSWYMIVTNLSVALDELVGDNRGPVS